MAISIINHIIYNNLVDKDYVENYTNGYDQLKDHVKDKNAEWASSITGIKVEDIKKLSTEIAMNQPVGIELE